MDKPLPLRCFKTDESLAMEDLISAGHDIEYVTHLTQEAFNNADDKNCGERLYFENALTTYARPFATGVRTRLKPEDIFGKRVDALNYHNYLIEQRNKLVAHNVNPFEGTTVGLIVSPGGQVVGVGSLTGRLVAFTKSDYDQFNKIANMVLGFINEKLKELEQKVLSQARHLTKKELLGLEVARFTAPGPDSVSKSKRKV